MSVSNNPVISVIMSTYNEPLNYIEESIDSILNQTYLNLEIILINDNPQRAELREFLMKYEGLDERVRYVENEINKGLVYSLNKGLDIAGGEYIARMDADDISQLDRLQKQLDYLRENQLSLVGCNITKIDENGHALDDLKMPISTEEIKKYSQWGSCVLHPTWLATKEIYKKLNGYRNVHSCEDYDFLLRALLSDFKLGNLPENKLLYRIRTNSISVQNNVDQRLISYYLVENYKNNKITDLEELDKYIDSELMKKNRRLLQKYYENKEQLKNSNGLVNKLLSGISMVSNKYFYCNLVEHAMKKKREQY